MCSDIKKRKIFWIAMKCICASYTIETDDGKIFHCTFTAESTWEVRVPKQKKTYFCNQEKAINWQEAVISAAVYYGMDDLPELIAARKDGHLKM